MKERVLGTVLCVCLAGLAAAQSFNTGTLIGTATDPSGAVVPGAEITIVDSTTGQSRSVITSSAGQYSFPGVPPGTYSVKARHSGFSEVSVPQVVIEVGR
jgi:protocatechuate 3,4-dioxygenase beta subunit